MGQKGIMYKFFTVASYEPVLDNILICLLPLLLYTRESSATIDKVTLDMVAKRSRQWAQTNVDHC